MPNWTANSITLRGDKQKLAIFKKKVKGKNGAIDFNRIVPMPENSDTFYADGGFGTEERKKYGKNNWYDWSRENWGTKWNACHIEIEAHDDLIMYQFDTAWDAPRPLVDPIMKLAQELGLLIVWDADHEDGGYESIVDTEELNGAA